jgi:SAM-dependent methyltransferase
MFLSGGQGRGAMRPLASAILVLLLATGCAAPPGEAGFTPQVGQPGKDVIWVPTPESLVDKMLEIAKTTSKDFVVDLGAGDGRIAIAAAKKYGAPSLGIEYDADMVALARRNAAKAGVANRAHFQQADIFEVDFSQASVVTMYLLPGLNIRLRPKILALKPGTRVVSHRFNMGDWLPDQTIWIEDRQAHLWIVPARVEGAWQMTIDGPAGPLEYQLKLRQEFQSVEGELQRGANAKMFQARLVGDRLSFVLVEADTARTFVGEVAADRIAGTIRTEGLPEFRWRAARR